MITFLDFQHCNQAGLRPTRAWPEFKVTGMKFWRKPLDLATIRPLRGRVVIIEERCKGCSFCIEYCAREVLAMSEAFNRKGYHFPRATKPELCVNCHFCEAVCPEFAIFSLEEEAQA